MSVTAGRRRRFVASERLIVVGYTLGGVALVGLLAYGREHGSVPAAAGLLLVAVSALCMLLLLRRNTRRYKNMLNTLRRDKERYRSLFRYHPYAIYEMGPDGRHIRINRRSATPPDRSEADHRRINLDEVGGPELFENCQPTFEATLRGEPQLTELALPRRDGRRRWAQVTTIPIVTGGKVTGLYAIIKDISQERRLQERLNLLDTCVQHLNDALMITEACPLDSPGPRIIFVNRAFERLTGYTSTEVIGKTPRLLQGPGTQRTALDAIRAALAAGHGTKQALINYRRSGEPYWNELDIVPIHNAQGHLGHYAAVQRDITDRKRVEGMLRHQTRALEMLAAGAPLRDVLEVTALLTNEIASDLVCAVIIPADDGVGPWRAIGPSLPQALLARLLESPGPPAEPEADGGAFTADLEHLDHPLATTAAAQGFRARFTLPLATTDGRPAGRLEAYLREPRKPNPYERSILRMAAQIATLALESRRREETIKLWSQALESTVECIAIADTERRMIKVNRAFEEVTGYRESEVLGHRPTLARNPTMRGADPQLWDIVEERGAWQGETWQRRRAGEWYPAFTSITALKDDNGKVHHYVAVFNDITKHKDTEQRIEFLTHHDPLTSLPNRVLFHELLGEAISRHRGTRQALAVLVIDLDEFKAVNDSLGHQAGDKLLKAIAEQLRRAVGERVTLAHLGGDEFAVLADQLTSTEEAAVLASRLAESLSSPTEIDGHRLVTSASIGISCFPGDGNDRAELIKNAELAMYQAKKRGRNNYQYFSAEMNRSANESLRLLNGLREAVREGRFELVYQPTIRLADGAMVGVEALLRWRHGELGPVSPEVFIPLAERNGLIEPIGDLVLERACRQMTRWERLAPGALSLSINLSAGQLRSGHLADNILARLGEHGLKPRQLTVEVTETAVMEDPEASRLNLEALAKMGVTIAVDDFGTGYSSLSYLKRLPIDLLKIDKSFIGGIPDDHNDVAICRAVLALADSMGLTVLAEGVETEVQLQALRGYGCTLAQGFLFGPPMSTDAITGLLQQREPADD